jgi:hypothetical protein
VLEAVLDDLVLWDRGTFTMHPLGLTTQAFDPPIAIDTLLLDTMRRLDELAAWREGEFAPEAVPCLVDEGARSAIEAPAGDPIARAVLRQVDGRKSIEEIVRAIPLGAYAVYQVIADSYEQGQLQILTYRGGRPAAAPPPVAIPSRVRTTSVAASAILFASLACLAILSAVVLRERILEDRASSRAAAVLWAEADVERALEAYRYGHGAYPASLGDVTKSGIPLPRDAESHWAYRSEGSTFTLAPSRASSGEGEDVRDRGR